MRTLGIETSCDETAVAVLDGDGRVEAHLLTSQIARHAPFGGVVPEVASREHLRALPWMVERVLESVPGPPELVAVTAGPGLVGALLVGVRYATAYAWSRRLPLVAVDHLHGHLVSPFVSLDGEPASAAPEPTLSLVASGGHSAWYLLTADGATRLCRTRDDAAGETLDKVAQAIGLPYPGGPHVDRLAREGDPTAFALPQPRLKDDSGDFSFSGLKSAAIRLVRDHRLAGAGEDRLGDAGRGLLASLEGAVVDQLLRPLPELYERYRPAAVSVSGGVAANTLLRRRISDWGHASGCPVAIPERGLTTDNAVMIARAGQLAAGTGRRDDPRRLDATPRAAWQPPGMRRRASTDGVG